MILNNLKRCVTGATACFSKQLEPIAFQQQRTIVLSSVVCGVPKRRVPLEHRQKKKRGKILLYPYMKSYHNWDSCENCGEATKKYHMCATCYQQTRFETQKVREFLKENNLDLNKESVIAYSDDKANAAVAMQDESKQVIEIERKRPLGWFDSKMWNQ